MPLPKFLWSLFAGILEMDRKRFSFYNVVGSVAWVFIMILGGHYLQKWILTSFGFDLKKHLEVIVIGIVLVTTLPVIFKLFFKKSKK